MKKTRTKAQRLRRARRQRTRRLRQRRRKPLRGGSLPIPNGSIASVQLDPTDEYGVPTLVRKEVYEEEVAED